MHMRRHIACLLKLDGSFMTAYCVFQHFFGQGNENVLNEQKSSEKELVDWTVMIQNHKFHVILQTKYLFPNEPIGIPTPVPQVK